MPRASGAFQFAIPRPRYVLASAAAPGEPFAIRERAPPADATTLPALRGFGTNHLAARNSFWNGRLAWWFASKKGRRPKPAP